MNMSVALQLLFEQLNSALRVKKTVGIFMLSVLYALCAQPCICMPFGLVPIYLHPLPLYGATLLFGEIAVYAWVVYLVQGVLGFPVFYQGGAGFIHLMGPTGGYLVGMLLSAFFLHISLQRVKRYGIQMLVVAASFVLVYICGLGYLFLFIPTSKLLATGLYPFLPGCFLKIASLGYFLRHKAT